MAYPKSIIQKAVSLIFVFSVFFSTTAFSQSCPAQGTQIFPELSGQELLDALVQEYGTTDNISYDNARDILYSQIDNKNDTLLTGIYTGYTIVLDPNADPSTDAFNKGINAEHSWPQSKGASTEPARSDMHHLFPAYSRANSARGNHPFYEIPDQETETWWRLDQDVSNPDGNVIDEYSEYRNSHPNASYSASWEPREVSKGDVARAAFYFYTMYKTQADNADPIFFEIQKDFLRNWNSVDAVSTTEYNRTCAIAEIQGNEVNPFVIDPTLIERAYFEGDISQTNVEFSATVLSFDEGQSSVEIEVSITNPNADTATTVDVVYSGGTATSGEDFQAFTSQTLTFPAGSLDRQSVTLTLTDDEIEEGNETIILGLEDVSGPQNAVVGPANSAEITIRDNDGETPSAAWINEMHYDNDGGDQGEFVEIAVNAEFADLTDVTLSLYNGNGGSVYATYSGNDFTAGDAENGISFFYVDLPVNGLQNGSPDGMSLDIGGELIQFLSYEGTFTAADGPAQDVESTDIGIEQPGNSSAGSSLSLAGTGSGYADFSWEFTETNTKGSLNTNQTIEGTGSGNETTFVDFTAAEQLVLESDGTVQVSLSITNPDSETATSVQVSQAGGTATENDFESFTTQNLTFPAGSSANQSFSITITDDDEYEKNETILLAIESISGPSNAEIGIIDTLSVTIRNDDEPQFELMDFWINEFHYQNAGADSNEFVEIVANLGSVTKTQNEDDILITLYNGNNGEQYSSFSGDDILAEEINYAGFQIYYVETEGLQNGDPDGISLSIQGEVVQFISYGGTFVAADGPAKDYESIDVGVIETESTTNGSISLTGTGQFYNEFSWAITDSSTKGSENKGQELQITTSNEDENPTIADDFKLHQNYPNPFNPTTNITYELKGAVNVTLTVYNVLGQKVETLVDGMKSAGSHMATFDASGLSSGVYFYQLRAGERTFTQKMLLSK
ncbi:endonuclease [Gracilimonas sp.]|uniref:Calx-beta domain-containing protein n=1 Tax=Gracilimonas sp. TaxID=1974203 RepID=UPI0032EB54A0